MADRRRTRQRSPRRGADARKRLTSMEIEGTRRDSSGQDIRISAKDGGVAAYRIDKVVVEGVSESKVATELFP